MGILKEIQDIIVEHAGASALNERLLLLSDKFEKLSEENVKLKEENARLTEERRDMARRLENYAKRDDFTEYRGALFKRDGSGGYRDGLYCPKCRMPMTAFGPFPYRCDDCGRDADFGKSEFTDVVNALNAL